jgi:hypothetical protein
MVTVARRVAHIKRLHFRPCAMVRVPNNCYLVFANLALYNRFQVSVFGQIPTKVLRSFKQLKNLKEFEDFKEYNYRF